MSEIKDDLMEEIARDDYIPISTEKDLETFLKKHVYKTVHNDYYSSWVGFRQSPALWRTGQCFSNCLPIDLEAKINGTVLDPFAFDDMEHVLKALDYLILSE